MAVNCPLLRRRPRRRKSPRREAAPGQGLPARGGGGGVPRGRSSTRRKRSFGERGLRRRQDGRDRPAGGHGRGHALQLLRQQGEHLSRARRAAGRGVLGAAAGHRRRGRRRCATAWPRITEATFDYMESHAPMFMLFEQVGGHAALAVRRACGPGAERLRARYLRLFQVSSLEAGVRAGRRAPRICRSSELTLVFTGSVHGLLRGWLLDGRQGRLRDRPASCSSIFLEGAAPAPARTSHDHCPDARSPDVPPAPSCRRSPRWSPDRRRRRPRPAGPRAV